MNIRPTPIAAAIASLLACSLLAACGGGGGGGMVRSPEPSAPPAPAPPPPPPPPPAAPAELCPAPITSDCVVTTGGVILEGRESAHALVVRTGTDSLGLVGKTDPIYRFDKGTRIESGTLIVGGGSAGNVGYHFFPAALISDTTVEEKGRLAISGWTARIVGNVVNRGHLGLGIGSIEGNLSNDGITSVDLDLVYFKQARILGDFTQASSGTLSFVLPPGALAPTGVVMVTGRARLGGTLELHPYSDGWGTPYPLPDSGAHHILHADSGVIGEFARWTSPGLFMEGGLRYGSNDVWFDLKRASLAPAMASNGVGSALTLASANNLERLFVRTDGLAMMAPGALSDAQRRLLASAGSVLRIDDIDQATRTLDSLSGAMHAEAIQATLQQGLADAATGERMAVMQPGAVAGAWSKTGANAGVSGFDQWLSPRLLIGVQAGQGSNDTHDTFGQSSRLSPQTGAYLRWFGDDGWYAGGSAGYAQHTLALDRTLDLDRGGLWNAHARHRFSVVGMQAEAGRRLSFAGGTLTPYVALDATALRSERTIEQGRTGFELALQPAMRAHLGANLGMRFGRDWRIGDTGWLRLDADARAQRRVADAGDPLRAAFVGVPDLWFDLPGHENRTSGWLDLGLRGGFGRDWSWSFAHARSLGAAPTPGPDWRFGLRLSF